MNCINKAISKYKIIICSLTYTMESINNYTCSGNGETFQGKPWISLNIKRWDDLDGPVTFSSYLEYKGNLDKLPRRHFNLVLNKEDFNEPRPIIHKPKQETFNFLTETEIKDMTNDEYNNYKQELSDFSMMNPIRSEIYFEQMANDNYTREIEEDYPSEDEFTEDDY